MHLPEITRCKHASLLGSRLNDTFPHGALPAPGLDGALRHVATHAPMQNGAAPPGTFSVPGLGGSAPQETVYTTVFEDVLLQDAAPAPGLDRTGQLITDRPGQAVLDDRLR